MPRSISRWNLFWMNKVQTEQNVVVVNVRKVKDEIRSLVNARSLGFERAR